MSQILITLSLACELSPRAMSLYLFILAWADESGVCKCVDGVAELETAFNGINFENSLEELVQAGLIEEQYFEECIGSTAFPNLTVERRDARIVWFKQRAQSRLSGEKWGQLRAKVFERDGYTCRYCGQRGTADDLECDHVEPISLGGTNEMGNLVTTCQACNRCKRDKMLEEWRGRGVAA